MSHPVGGRFRRGPDPRRHVLTKEDRRRGFATTFGLVMLGRVSQCWLAGRVKTTCSHPR